MKQSMRRKLVVVISQLTRRHKDDICRVAEGHDFETYFFARAAEALPAVRDAEVVFGQSAVLARNAPHLQWLCTPSAGVDQFLEPGVFASPNAILTNSSGAYGVTIAEHILMVVLEMFRRRQEYAQIVARREWTRDLPVRSIHGSRIALLGTGDIGQKAAVRLRAFCPARITGVNRGGKNPRNLFDGVVRQDLLETVLPHTDLLVISLPDTAETRCMIDKRRLALLPDGALIVNVGRGCVINQAALEKELRAGRLFAALDVFEREPVPREDSIWDCPNLIMTPHVAGNMTLPYTKDRIVSLFLEDFENYCAGKPLKRQVNLHIGY